MILEKCYRDKMKTTKLIGMIGTLVSILVTAGCQTVSYYPEREMEANIEKMVSEKKCDKAVALYDSFKAKFQNNRFSKLDMVRMTTHGYGKDSLAACLLESGRQEEIIYQYESACFTADNANLPLTSLAVYCDFAGNKVLDAAYASVGRTNPLAANPQILAELKANADYSNKLDSAVTEIFKQVVTTKPSEVGTPSGELRYEQEMREASVLAIRLIDSEIAKYQNDHNSGRMRKLKEIRLENEVSVAEHGGKITELNDSHEAAERIRGISSAILDTLTVVAPNKATNSPSLMNTAGSARLFEPRYLPAPQCPQRPKKDYSGPYGATNDPIVQYNPSRCTTAREEFERQAANFWTLVNQHYPNQAEGQGKRKDGDFGSPKWAKTHGNKILSGKDDYVQGSRDLKTNLSQKLVQSTLWTLEQRADDALCELEKNIKNSDNMGGYAEDYAIVRARYNLSVSEDDIRACMLLSLHSEKNIGDR